MNDTTGPEKRCRKEGEWKNCESGTDLSEDSAYTSYGALPSTPLDSVQLPSGVDSCQEYSVESAYTSTNNFADLETSPVEKPMDFFPAHFSTPTISARHDRKLYYQKNYILFKEHIEPLHKMLDRLISQGCRDGLLSEKIREAQSRELRANILVKYAAKHLSQQSFEDLLRISDYTYLIDNMNQTKVSELVIPEDEDESNLLSDTQFQNFLKSEIEPLHLIEKLLEQGVLSFEDHDDLLKASVTLERVTNLLKYLEERLQIQIVNIYLQYSNTNTQT